MKLYVSAFKCRSVTQQATCYVGSAILKLVRVGGVSAVFEGKLSISNKSGIYDSTQEEGFCMQMGRFSITGLPKVNRTISILT
jgi:hypothetical protein